MSVVRGLGFRVEGCRVYGTLGAEGLKASLRYFPGLSFSATVSVETMSRFCNCSFCRLGLMSEPIGTTLFHAS